MPNWYASATSATSVRTKAELRAVASPFRTAGGIRRRGNCGSARNAAVPVSPHRCGAEQPQNQARAQTAVWRAAMSYPIVSFNEGQLSNGPNKSKMGDAEDD